MTGKTILLVLAVISFALAAFAVSVLHIGLEDLGFAFVTASFLVK